MKLNAQVPKKVLVEHFTNTRCSICASRNPGLYSNLNANPTIMHLAFHPSAPYSSCLLNNYNVSENDARTNFYGVYGSTPRLVINGVVVSSGADYSNPSLFNAYTGQSANFQIIISQFKAGTDSIKVHAKIIKLNTVSFTTATLFAGIFEDTIFYASPNGESKHFDVFRNSYTGPQGISVSIPSTIGDSIVYTKTIKLSGTLNMNRIYSSAVLQNTATKELLQAEKTAVQGKQNGTGMTLKTNNALLFNAYPNPAKDKINLYSETQDLKLVYLINSIGELIASYTFINSLEVDLRIFPRGIYLLKTVTGECSQQKILIRN